MNWPATRTYNLLKSKERGLLSEKMRRHFALNYDKFKYYIKKAQDVSVKDCLSVFPMLCALILLPFFKRKYTKTWAICERPDEACDNGYHFFKYMTQKHPEQDCIYFINKKCRDYEKVRDLGKVKKFGGVIHWIVFFSAEYLISPQAFAPNGYVGTFLVRSGIFVPIRLV